jgi:hypothetical protein
VKSATKKVNAFIKILSHWNITVKVYGMTLIMADYCRMLYYDAPDMMCHRKRNSSCFKFALSRINGVVYTKLCFMSWLCAYVFYYSFYEYYSIRCPAKTTCARRNLKTVS